MEEKSVFKHDIESNLYLNRILYKKNTILDKIKFLWFIHKIKKHSPSYFDLIDMASCIKLLNIIFFYPNHNGNGNNIEGVKSTLFTKSISNGVLLEYYPTDSTRISIQLTTNRNITISIYDCIRVSVQSKVSFKDRELVIDNKHDEQLFLNIIYHLNMEFANILKYYYFTKKF